MASSVDAASSPGAQRRQFLCVLLTTMLVLLWAGGGIEVVVVTPTSRPVLQTSPGTPRQHGDGEGVEHVAGGEPMSFEPAGPWTLPPWEPKLT